jgi:hypothetical protein
MIEHIWTIVCRVTCIDRFSNNVSLIEVVEQLRATPVDDTEEHVPAQLDIVTLWSRSNDNVPTRGAARTRLVAPGGEELLNVEYEVDLTNHPRARNRGRIVGFPVTASGKYEFRTERRLEDGGWETLGTYPVWVTAPAEDQARENGRPEVRE